MAAQHCSVAAHFSGTLSTEVRGSKEGRPADCWPEGALRI